MLLNRKLWIIISSILVVGGIIGGATIAIYGKNAMGTSNFVAWGALIAAYVFFAISATGLSLVSSIGHVFKFKRFEVLGKRAVLLSICMLLIAFVMIGLELGNPFKMYYLLLTPNLASGIFWMGMLYGIYLVLYSFEFFYMLKDNHKVATRFGIAVLITAIAASSNLGALFGYITARPYWTGAFTSVYIIITALLSGAAILSILFFIISKVKKDEIFEYKGEHVVSSLGKLLAVFIGMMLFISVWKNITSMYGSVPGNYEAVMAVLVGPLAAQYWIFEIIIGMLIPLAILLLPKGFTPIRVFIAAIMTIIGVFVMRLTFVFAGQTAPLEIVKGMTVEPYRTFSITWAEWLLMSGGVGAVILMYLIGEKLLNLRTVPHDSLEHHAEKQIS